MDTPLENTMVRLRAPEHSDIDILYIWENNMEIWKVSNTITPFSRFVLKKYIETAHLDIWDTKQLRLMIEAKDQNPLMFTPVGVVDLFDFDPFHLRAGIGILVANSEYRQKGYASEALKLMIRYSFETLQLHQIYCNIAADNSVSQQLFLNAGFEQIGVKKEWLKVLNGWQDEIMYQHVNPNLKLPRN